MSFHKLFPYQSPDRDGRVPLYEREIIAVLALNSRHLGLHAAEIGTFCGDTTTTIARAMPDHIVLTVDIPADAEPTFDIDPANRKYIGNTPEFGSDVRDRIEQIWCDSALLTFPATLAIGFAFIDGAHTYEYAKNDFEKIKPFVVPNGCVVFHDVGMFEEVSRAVNEIMDTHRDWMWSAFEGTSLVWGFRQ